MQWEALGFAGIEMLLVLLIVLGLVLGAVFLLLAMKLIGGYQNTEFGSVFVTALINALVGWICCIIAWYVIKIRHCPESWGKAILAWLLSGLLADLIAFGIYVAIFGFATLQGLVWGVGP